MQILIVTGGNIDCDFALDFLKEKKYDEIIAVDGALAFFEKEEVKARALRPTHIVGDFDTIGAAVLEKYKAYDEIAIHAFNPQKDYTDTDIALKLAMSLAGEDGAITILGATGTRLDHSLANIQMLIAPQKKGIDCQLVDAHNRIRMIEGEFILSECYGKYVSLITVTMVLEGIDLVGFKYPLKDRTVYMGESLCVSNELIKEKGFIRIRKGIALLIESKD